MNLISLFILKVSHSDSDRIIFEYRQKLSEWIRRPIPLIHSIAVPYFWYLWSICHNPNDNTTQHNLKTVVGLDVVHPILIHHPRKLNGSLHKSQISIFLTTTKSNMTNNNKQGHNNNINNEKKRTITKKYKQQQQQ